MRKREHAHAALMIATLMACGGAASRAPMTSAPSGSEAPPGPPPLLATDFAPEATFAMARIDLLRLRQSPYADELIELATEEDQANIEQDSAHRLSNTDAMWIMLGRRVRPVVQWGVVGRLTASGHVSTDAGAPDADASQPDASAHAQVGAVLSQSGMTPDTIATEISVTIAFEGHDQGAADGPLLRSILAGNDWRAEALPPGSPRLWRTDTLRDRFALAVDDHLIVVGLHGDPDAAVAVATREAQGRAIASALHRVADASGFGSHGFDLVIMTDADAQAMVSELLTPETAEQLRSISGQLELATGLTVSMQVRTDSPEAAAAVKVAVDAGLAQLVAEPTLTMLGLTDPMRAAHTHVDETVMVLELQLDDAATRTLLARLTGIVRIGAALQAVQPAETPVSPQLR